MCLFLFLALAPTEVIDPCNPTPCGENAICTDRLRAAACQCISEYFGDPYVACRPECTINADCPSTKACQNLHCVDPCPGVCGINAECRVINHLPSCTCIPGYRGDPFTACSLIPSSKHFIAFLHSTHVFYYVLFKFLQSCDLVRQITLHTRENLLVFLLRCRTPLWHQLLILGLRFGLLHLLI